MDKHSDTNYIALLRSQLVKHLKGGMAFMPIEEMLQNITFDHVGIIPEALPYSFYQQFFHMRAAQFDILEFSRNPHYAELNWPEDYWPDKKAPQDEKEWENLVDTFFKEREEFADIVTDPSNDLFTALLNGSGQTLIREVILATEHNAYHTGQLLVILRLVGQYESKK